MTKILLVEDDKSLREIYGTRLLAENFDIVSAGDGEEALAMAIKEKPELIISDVMMPKISGFDMLDILRSTTETRDIKVIMMTALSSDDQRTRGEQLGADKYLVKSQVGIEDVVAAVHQVLGDGGTVASPVASPATDPSSSVTPASDDTSTVTDSASPAATDSSARAASGSAPGNDAAGPLPPQPSELVTPEPPVVTPVAASDSTDNSLPQPTAPFSGQRPTNLGEEVLHPEETSTSVPTTVTDTSAALEAPVSTGLNATPDATLESTAPTSSTNDNVASPEPSATAGGLGFDTPKVDETTVTTSVAPVPETTAPSTPETPSTLDAALSDLTAAAQPEKKDDTSSTPPASPTTPAV